MKGSVIQRGNKWSVVIDLGRDPVTDRRRRDWHSGFESEKDAEAARVRILAQLQAGEYVEPSKLTLADYLVGTWLPARKVNVKATTLANYEHQLRSYVIPYLGAKPLQQINAAQLTAFYAGLLEDGRRQGDGGLSATSVHNVHAVLRKALQDAVKWNLITRNPAASADTPSPGRKEMKTWTAEQLTTFLSAESATREHPLWRLAAMTGMRRGEVLGLPWSAVDLDAGRLSIVQTLVNVKATPTLQTDTKTTRGRRPVELDAQTVGVLREWRRVHAKDRLRAGPAWQENGLVFTRADGSLLKPDWMTRTFGSRIDRVGLPKIRLHDLRHTWATLALASGVHPKVVQERLGHSSIQVTLDTYSHVVPGMDRDAAETVAALIGGH